MDKIVLSIILILFLVLDLKLIYSNSLSERIIKWLFLYVFIFGALEYFGLSEFIRKFFIDIVIILLLLVQIRKRNYKFIGYKYFLAFTIIVIFSMILSSSELYPTFTYYRTFLYPFIFFIAISNLHMPERKWLIFNNYIFSLFLLQIIASVFKYYFIGVNEKFLIGTVSATGGTFSTMIPLTAIVFLFSYYLIYKESSKYILLTFGFLFMGFMGAKRGIWLYLPILLIIIIYAYRTIKGKNFMSKSLIRVSLFITVFSIVTLIFGSKYSPTLNPDREVGGRFDTDYLQEYIVEYTFSRSEDNLVSHGRGANFLTAITHMYNIEWQTALFGYGPESGKGVRTYGEGIWEIIGINGPITGITYHLVQIGILSMLLILFLSFKTSSFLYYLAKKEIEPYWKAFALGSFMVSIVFLIDFITYSSSFVSTIFPLSFTFAYLSAVCYKRYMVHINSEHSYNYLPKPEPKVI